MQRYCVHCLETFGEYRYMKTLSKRENKKFVKSGIYFCDHCFKIVVEKDLYNKIRGTGHHVIKQYSGEHVEEL